MNTEFSKAQHAEVVNAKSEVRRLEENAKIRENADHRIGLELALTYLNAPSVDPGYDSVQKLALAALNEWLEENGYEIVL